jgi:sporulation protein YlmC with PRC-barrel domain
VPSSRLRHLDASQVETPLGSLDNVEVLSSTDHTLGRVEGVIVDPDERHVRYYVVESHDWFKTHRYLVPEMPCRIDPERKALKVELEADSLARLPELREDEFPPLSADELDRR